MRRRSRSKQPLAWVLAGVLAPSTVACSWLRRSSDSETAPCDSRLTVEVMDESGAPVANAKVFSAVVAGTGYAGLARRFDTQPVLTNAEGRARICDARQLAERERKHLETATSELVLEQLGPNREPIVVVQPSGWPEQRQPLASAKALRVAVGAPRKLAFKFDWSELCARNAARTETQAPTPTAPQGQRQAQLTWAFGNHYTMNFGKPPPVAHVQGGDVVLDGAGPGFYRLVLSCDGASVTRFVRALDQGSQLSAEQQMFLAAPDFADAEWRWVSRGTPSAVVRKGLLDANGIAIITFDSHLAPSDGDVYVCAPDSCIPELRPTPDTLLVSFPGLPSSAERCAPCRAQTK